MFFSLLFVTLITSLLTSAIVALIFRKSIGGILSRVLRDEISLAWQRYIMFAVIVVGLSSGVNLYKLEQYTEGAQGRWVERPGVEKQHDDQQWQPPVLNNETWTLEIYRSIVGTIQGIAWALLVFFLVSLVAFVIVRGQEIRAKI